MRTPADRRQAAWHRGFDRGLVIGMLVILIPEAVIAVALILSRLVLG